LVGKVSPVGRIPELTVATGIGESLKIGVSGNGEVD